MKRILPLLAATLSSFCQLGAQCLTIANCPTAPIAVCDFSDNDTKLWNAGYWYDNGIGSHDLAEGMTDFAITATDACFSGDLSFRYQLFLDLNGDGVMETVVDSKTPPYMGGVNFGNAANPNYVGGTFQLFDQRAVPFWLKYRFAIQISGAGNTKTAKLRWRTDVNPVRFTTPRLPYGTHKIKWFVETALGEEKVCEYVFTVRDCEKPAVACGSGINVNIMQTDFVTLWAGDFLQYTEDNVTPADQIKISIRKPGTGTGFPEDANGNPIANVNFTCDETGPQSIELWAEDLAGNAGYCTTTVVVQDNNNYCVNNGASPKVCVQGFCSGEPVSDVVLAIATGGGGIPPFTFMEMTDNQGCGTFNTIPVTISSQISAAKDDNPLQGVTQYDINLLMAHLDGTQPFTDPLQYIAADVNKDNVIDNLDLIELQNGLSGGSGNINSWRFIRGDYVLPPNPLLTPIPETVSLAEVLASSDATFVFKGIKIGDISCSVGFNGEIPVERQAPSTEFEARVFPPQPNPTTGHSTIMLQLLQAENVRLDVFDISGKTLYSIENQMNAGPGALEIPADSRFTPGIYFWKVQVAGAVYSGKLVIQ